MSDDPIRSRRREKVEHTPQATQAPTEPPMPRVEAPSLEGIEVVVFEREVTREDLLRRFEELRREHARVEPLPRGATLAPGDEAELEWVAYAGPKPIPGSAQQAAWLPISPDPALPGLFEALTGAEVGGRREVSVRLPEDSPLERFRGTPAKFGVRVLAARRVVLPPQDDASFLEALGGEDLDGALAAVADSLDEELEGALWEEAEERVLDVLVSRADIPLDEALIDEELFEIWNVGEGAALGRAGVDSELLDEALEGWLSQPALREESARRLRVSLILEAILQQEGLEPPAGLVEELLEEVVEGTERTVEQLRDQLAKDPELKFEVEAFARRVTAVEHVMSKVETRFAPDPREEADEDPAEGPAADAGED